VTIRWFTDADREDMRNAKEEQRILAELELAEARRRPPGAEGVPMTEEQLQKVMNLKIDPTRRRRD
jgi:hypothetical protein